MPATGWVFFNGGINVGAGGNKLLNGLITKLSNEMDFQSEYADQKDILMFYEQQALSIDETFSGIAGPLEIDQITENGVKNEGSRTKLPNKGFDIIEYGEKLTTSYLMYQWLLSAQSIKGADMDIKKEWKQIARDSTYLIEGAMMRMVIEMTKVYTQGFWTPSTVKGPGSPTPKGNPLFSILHTSRNGALTWRNMGTSSYLNQPITAADGKVRIQNALDVLKDVMRLENGKKLKRPKAWDLIVSTTTAPIAAEILNVANNGRVSEYASDGNNASKKNIFNFEGNMVNLVELEILWDYDKNGNAIGTSLMWFMRNPLFVQKSKCFKMVKLYNPVIKNYTNPDSDAQIVDVRVGYAVDHYGAECGVFGSKWDGDTAYAV